MINIKKNEINKVCLTLNEKLFSGITSGYTTGVTSGMTYLFSFKSESTLTTKNFIASDISNYTDRYNLFEIEDNATEDLLNGKINIPSGDYVYSIYIQDSLDNLSLTGLSSTQIVEIGRATITGISTSNPINPIYL